MHLRFTILDLFISTGLFGCSLCSLIGAGELLGRASYELALICIASSFSFAGAAVGQLVSSTWRGAVYGLMLFFLALIIFKAFAPRIQ